MTERDAIQRTELKKIGWHEPGTTEKFEYGVDLGDEIEAPFTRLEDARSYIASTRQSYAANGFDPSLLEPGTILVRTITIHRTEWRPDEHEVPC